MRYASMIAMIITVCTVDIFVFLPLENRIHI